MSEGEGAPRRQLMTCGSKGIGMRADRPQIQTTTLRRVSKSVETGRCLSEFLFAGVPSSRRPRFPAWPGGKRGSSESSVSHWVRARGSFGGLSTGDHPSKPFPMFALGSRVAMRPAGIVFHPRKGGGTLSFGGFHARVLDVFLPFSIKSGPKRVDTVRCITASNASLCENDIPRMPLTGENPHPRGRRYSQSWSSDSP